MQVDSADDVCVGHFHFPFFLFPSFCRPAVAAVAYGAMVAAVPVAAKFFVAAKNFGHEQSFQLLPNAVWAWWLVGGAALSAVEAVRLGANPPKLRTGAGGR